MESALFFDCKGRRSTTMDKILFAVLELAIAVAEEIFDDE